MVGSTGSRSKGERGPLIEPTLPALVPGPSRDEGNLAAERAPLWTPSPSALMAEFAQWLVRVGETDGIARLRLLSLHYEFCEVNNRAPLTEGQIFRHARSVGIERHRLPTGRRQWRYRIRNAEMIDLAKGKAIA
jgi:hypothetical protein